MTGWRRAARTAGRRSTSTSARSTACSRPFLAAGFYYKTFMWPAAFWEKLYEPLIRRAAGLGRASYEADPDRYEKCWAHCDLLVIGAGPAGLAAALAAGRAGARVILADEALGSAARCSVETATIGGGRRPNSRSASSTELASLPNVRCSPAPPFSAGMTTMSSARSSGCRSMSLQPAPDVPLERLWRIVAKQRDPRHRRGRAAAGVRRQRQARRDDGRRDAHLSQPLRRRPGQAAGDLHHQ